MPKRYFILGPNASIFWDPTSRLKVISNDPENPDVLEVNSTHRIEQALKQNHIQEIRNFKQKNTESASVASVDKAEEKKEKKSAAPSKPPVAQTPTDLTKMSKDQLVAYYIKNYEVTDEDIKNFTAMKPKAMVEFLEDEDLVS